jgi:hypothetical protein
VTRSLVGSSDRSKLWANKFPDIRRGSADPIIFLEKELVELWPPIRRAHLREVHWNSAAAATAAAVVEGEKPPVQIAVARRVRKNGSWIADRNAALYLLPNRVLL